MDLWCTLLDSYAKHVHQQVLSQVVASCIGEGEGGGEG